MKRRITLLTLTMLTITLSLSMMAGTSSPAENTPCCKCDDCEPKHLWLCFCDNGKDCEDHIYKGMTF